MSISSKEFLATSACRERGVTPETLESYRTALLEGYSFATISRNCTLGKEIKFFSDTEKERLRERYNKDDRGVLKFVPASGAASRMFKNLFSALNSGEYDDKANKFFKEIEKYAFCEVLLGEAGLEQKTEYSNEEKRQILRTLLSAEGLDFGRLPKGMIPFHDYGDHYRTAFEEHFHEGMAYARKNDLVKIHFTVPVDTQAEVLQHLEEVKNKLESASDVRFDVSTSLQKPSTDTPCIFVENENWVTTEGKPLFRPAGHGALLENLNELNEDIIFIKNIDNVVPDSQRDITTEYKELIAGVLIEVQEGIFSFLRDLKQGRLAENDLLNFVKQWFGMDRLPKGEKALFEFLNRPIRVCGMVKNEGEPGGGPFMILESDGSESLQIVEKAQIDLSNPDQKSLLSGASHFNPVDLVVGMKDYSGEKFDLLEYRNPQLGMRVEKTVEGRDIYALELPGLWNGSMHYWHTVFVEVPIETFNPVKTVFDLTRPSHQA
jgi:hypothetical protein